MDLEIQGDDMASPFESVTRVAIKEIVSNRANESKFGFVMTHDDLDELCNDLFNLFLTSRNLKAAGDRMIHGTGPKVGKHILQG